MAISKIILNGVTQMDLTSDTVAANNLIAPNTAHGADGEAVVGVASGGSSAWTKVCEKSYQISNFTTTSATTQEEWATGHNELWTSDKLVYVRIRDTAGKRAGYFYGSDQFFYNIHPVNGNTTSTSATTWIRMYFRYTNTGYGISSATSTTGYGVYADTVYPDGSIRIRKRYSSTNSLTINGTYKVEVYLLDPPTGAPIFE